MPFQLTRQQLYDLVWSEAMKRLSGQIGISDVALAKTCRKVGVPVPERGYWNKLQAGHKVARTPLPASDLATVNRVEISGSLTLELRRRMDGEPGVLDPGAETIEVLTERFRKRLGRVSVPQTFAAPHPSIARLLAKDEEHRQKRLSERYYWREPQFEAPVQRRRLRILNALFLAFERVDVSVSLRGYEELEAFAAIGGTSLPFNLEPSQRNQRGRTSTKESGAERLSLRLAVHQPPPGIVAEWSDAPGDLLEGRLDQVAVGMAVAAEKFRRHWAEQQAAFERQRREEAEREARRRAEEAAKRERERRAAAAQARIDALVSDADAFERAGRIRVYVAAVRAASTSLDDKRLETWSAWALGEADRLDPIGSGRAREMVGSFDPAGFEQHGDNEKNAG